MTVYTISVDGLIGAGKSTLINKLVTNSSLLNKINFIVIKEPIDIWTNLNFENQNAPEINFLKLFYEDQKKYGTLFQIFVLATRYKLYENTIKSLNLNPNSKKINILIFDRSLESTMLFTNILHQDNSINNIQFKIIQLLYNEYIKFLPKIDIRIFLDVHPKKAKQQIDLRNRDGENNITLEYLNKLYIQHQKYFQENKHYRIKEFQLQDIDIIIQQIDHIIKDLYNKQIHNHNCAIL